MIGGLNNLFDMLKKLPLNNMKSGHIVIHFDQDGNVAKVETHYVHDMRKLSTGSKP